MPIEENISEAAVFTTDKNIENETDMQQKILEQIFKPPLLEKKSKREMNAPKLGHNFISGKFGAEILKLNREHSFFGNILVQILTFIKTDTREETGLQLKLKSSDHPRTLVTLTVPASTRNPRMIRGQLLFPLMSHLLLSERTSTPASRPMLTREP